MKIIFLISVLISIMSGLSAQTNPAITSWLQNTTVTARHYVSGNSTPINDASLVNVQSVKYSTNYVYATTTGLPAYVTGPYLDGNPSVATSQNATFKFPLAPVKNNGTPTATTGGNIGVFINGVALFDYRDGASWQNSTGTMKGGPYGGAGDGVWNRDAVVGERLGFDCSKGHPAMGNYHHHQNPSAFKLDLNVINTVCNLYNADGLYAINASVHSPLIGFAYDGFPIYGAYGYKNADGTGGIVRMKSSYALRNITTRTTYADGSTVTAGPPVSATYPLGYFKEDYQYNPTSAATPDYLDEHNGRFSVTPEYPAGIYCYFSTVDANWNSAYPYVVGPTFYGTKVAAKVTSIQEPVLVYLPTPLGISLTSFSGTAKEKYNELKWETSSEVNNSYFQVERSADGSRYEVLGKINGHGNSSVPQSYVYQDSKFSSKRNMYRLKQVDNDGKSTCSNVIIINRNLADEDFLFSVFPNPASDLIAIQFNNIVTSNYTVSLFDMSGMLMQQTTMYQGTTIVYFDTQKMYSGQYVVRITDGNSVYTKRVVIAKN